MILLQLTAGCALNSPEIQPTPATIPTTVNDALVAPYPRDLQTDTSTIITISPTITPTILSLSTDIPINTQADDTIPSCQNSDAPSPYTELNEMEGFIFYTRFDKKEWYTLGGNPIQSKNVDLPTVSIDSFALSQNRQWLLAYSYQPESHPANSHYPVLLISPDGKGIAKEIDLSSMDTVVHDLASTFSFQYWVLEWVNNEIVKVNAAYGESSDGAAPLYMYGQVNIFQGTWFDVSFLSSVQKEPFSWTVISPDLSRLLFLNVSNDLVLWDVENQTELWAESAGISNQTPPIAYWSSDNLKVALWTRSNPMDIQILSRDGKNYTKVVKPIYTMPSQEFIPTRGHFQWSPNGQLLAISGIILDNNSGSKHSMIYVYDVEHEEYIYRCPLGDIDIHSFASDILWSPDGRFIVPEYSASKRTPFRLYDLRNNTIFQLNEAGYGAVAWLEQIPGSWK
jgi:hypothetical protein